MIARHVTGILAPLRRRLLTAAAAALAGSATLIATPASASQIPASSSACGATINYDHIQSQVDNCPGNGATSWAWLWVPNAGNPITGSLFTGYLYLTFGNGSTATVSTPNGTSTTDNWYGSGYNIVQVKMCEDFVTWNGIYTWQCSGTIGIP